MREDEPWEPPVVERAALVLWARTSGDGAVVIDSRGERAGVREWAAAWLESKLAALTDADRGVDAAFVYVAVRRRPRPDEAPGPIDRSSPVAEFGHGTAPASPASWPARRLAARDRVNRLVGPAIVLCVVIGSIVADGLGRQTLMIVEGIAGGCSPSSPSPLRRAAASVRRSASLAAMDDFDLVLRWLGERVGRDVEVTLSGSNTSLTARGPLSPAAGDVVLIDAPPGRVEAFRVGDATLVLLEAELVDVEVDEDEGLGVLATLHADFGATDVTMVDPPVTVEVASELQRRLRERRHEEARERSRRLLVAARVRARETATVEPGVVDQLWPRYVRMLRAGGSRARRWPAAQGDVMQRQLDAIAHRAGPDARAVWLVPVGTADAIGFEVPVAPVLRSALRHFVSPAADLMLATPTAADGLCVERNHAADGDEYELVAWGRFA